MIKSINRAIGPGIGMGWRRGCLGKRNRRSFWGCLWRPLACLPEPATACAPAAVSGWRMLPNYRRLLSAGCGAWAKNRRRDRPLPQCPGHFPHRLGRLHAIKMPRLFSRGIVLYLGFFAENCQRTNPFPLKKTKSFSVYPPWVCLKIFSKSVLILLCMIGAGSSIEKIARLL